MGAEPALGAVGCVCGAEPECENAGDVGVHGCSVWSEMPVLGERSGECGRWLVGERSTLVETLDDGW